jgi:hypothetical protein
MMIIPERFVDLQSSVKLTFLTLHNEFFLKKFNGGLTQRNANFLAFIIHQPSPENNLSLSKPAEVSSVLNFQ